MCSLGVLTHLRTRKAALEGVEIVGYVGLSTGELDNAAGELDGRGMVRRSDVTSTGHGRQTARHGAQGSEQGWREHHGNGIPVAAGVGVGACLAGDGAGAGAGAGTGDGLMEQNLQLTSL